jgi:glycosyltransferase involved in cell wall biosynthesis
MNNINYTFIIPHKNSPQYLNQCLNSIPRREDVQIVVIDDNSDKNIVDWDSFKFNDPTGIELVLTTEGKGAGYARNVGISKAKGKWLLFPDADDYYSNGLLNTLDKYKDLDLEVIYFNFNIIDESGLLYTKDKIYEYVSQYDGSKQSADIVKYRLNAPWLKMVRKEFVDKNNIKFEEVPIGNDCFFTLQLGYLSEKYLIIKDKLYNYIYYKKSMTRRNYDKKKILTQFNIILRSGFFFKQIGHKEWAHGFFYVFYELFKYKSLPILVKGTALLITNLPVCYKSRTIYTDKLHIMV